MQVIIVGMRVISILMFFFGAVYLFSRDGIKKVVPEGGVFNVGEFV